jgi:segregation and condensation protein B
VAGRPALYATSKAFLDDLNLTSLAELPPLDDLGALVETVGVPAQPPVTKEPEPEPEQLERPRRTAAA